MSGTTSASDLEVRKVVVEERKIILAERQFALDNHWTKRWVPLIIPGMITLAVAAISYSGLVISTRITSSESDAASRVVNANTALHDDEVKREDLLTDREKALEGARAAAQLYFDKLSGLESEPSLTQNEQNTLKRGLTLIALVSDTSEVRGIFTADATRIAENGQAETEKSGLQTNKNATSQALQGFPNLEPVPASGQYSASTFLAYPQVPGTNDPAEKLFVDSLKSLGFKVQPTQHMAANQSPDQNQIRFYRFDQADFAKEIAAELLKKTKMIFVPKQLSTPGLPNGVIEFWLGTNSAK